MTARIPNGGDGTVITVGSFDGVHRGHRRVLEEIAERARRSGRRSVLVTFEPHPLEVVNPAAAPALLTLADERREILAQCDLDVVVFLRFTPRLSRYSPEEFVRLLIDRFDMRELVIGNDHGFGRGRTCNVELLRLLGRTLRFGVDVVRDVEMDGRPVSSTLVRRAIAGGDLDTAARLLARPYSLTAAVIRGAGRGRDIGYRTINLEVPGPRKLLPPDGVYAAWVEWRYGQSGAMMHQGPRPTFDESERTIEAHLFDADVDLYGERVKLSWVRRLRDIVRFESPEGLKRQLDKDFVDARRALTGLPAPTSH
jgi:riboflavin kinase/FMN adenylyltransferase